MATQVQNRRGTTAEHSTFTGAVGELTVDTTKDVVVVHDGSTAGGFPMLRQDQANLPTSAPSNGVYIPSSNNVAISTNGTGRLFVDASGNVGINAAPPTASNAPGYREFAIRGGSTDRTGILRLNDSAGTTGGALYANEVSGLILEQPLARPITFSTNGSERARIDSSGRLGLGTSSAGDILHVKGGSTYAGVIADNSATTGGGAFRAYRNGVQKAIFCVDSWVTGTSSDDAAIYADAGGGIKFYTNNSSTAKAYLTSGGSLGIGTQTPQSPLVVSDGGAAGIEIRPALSDIISFNRVSGIWGNLTLNSANNVFQIQGGEVGRFDNSGRLLVGTSSARSNFYNSSVGALVQSEEAGANQALYSLVSNSTTANGPALVLGKTRGTTVGSTTVVQNGDCIGEISFQGMDGAEFVNGATVRGEIDGTPGANDLPSRLVFSTTADGASSPTERMRIRNDGRLLIGTTDGSTPSSTNKSFAIIYGNSDTAAAYFAGYANDCVEVDRKSNDGGLISFRQDGTQEGTISVSGTTVSYNGAHLSRWSQLVGVDPYDKTARPEILRGTVMSNLDEMCDWTCPTSGDCQDNEQLNKTEVSSVDDDPNVAGIFQSWDDDDDTWVNDFYLAMTGDFVVRIAAGTTVQRGDLLCSAGDGTARPQGDRFIKDSTIAKVTSTTVSCTHPDGSYCVPCVLMAC